MKVALCRSKKLRLDGAAATMANEAFRSTIPTCTLGGMQIASLSGEETANLIIDVARGRREDVEAPLYMTSSDAAAVSSYALSPMVREIYDDADVVSPESGIMVRFSHLLSRTPLAGPCDTTGLFHDVARRAPEGFRFFLFGATAVEVQRAADVTRQMYPHIEIAGCSHGFLDTSEERALLRRLDALQPDVLWLGLSVPKQRQFVLRNREKLGSVKVIRTCGTLISDLAATGQAAPDWLSRAGLAGLHSLWREPRRIARRLLVANPHSAYLMLAHSR
ncbi:MAG: WecB/TagA/CpsF family glycosyltransferase [Pseudomonadota bacterium]